MRIKKILPFILLVFLFISCEKEDFEIETNNQRTVFMYLPWSTNLTSYFYNNISDMEEAIPLIPQHYNLTLFISS